MLKLPKPPKRLPGFFNCAYTINCRLGFIYIRNPVGRRLGERDRDTSRRRFSWHLTSISRLFDVTSPFFEQVKIGSDFLFKVLIAVRYGTFQGLFAR